MPRPLVDIPSRTWSTRFLCSNYYRVPHGPRISGTHSYMSLPSTSHCEEHPSPSVSIHSKLGNAFFHISNVPRFQRRGGLTFIKSGNECNYKFLALIWWFNKPWFTASFYLHLLCVFLGLRHCEALKNNTCKKEKVPPPPLKSRLLIFPRWGAKGWFLKSAQATPNHFFLRQGKIEKWGVRPSRPPYIQGRVRLWTTDSRVATIGQQTTSLSNQMATIVHHINPDVAVRPSDGYYCPLRRSRRSHLSIR